VIRGIPKLEFQMTKFLNFALAAVATVVLASCGSTSALPETANKSGKTFSKVVVRDFKTSVKNPAVTHKLSVAQKSFSDQIVGEISKTGKFSKVSRNGKVDANTMIIDGTITNYDDGNAALKLLVGFAAGNANFDAFVNYRDSSGANLGTIKVDKNSWALGGAVAMSQTADSFILGAAKEVAKEASKFAR